MGRIKSASAVLPALLPGACVVLLAFQSGGFYPSSWALLAGVAAVALAVRVATVAHPFAGFNAWSGVVAAALALLGAWTLVSSEWSGAPGRALVESGRLLAYLLVFVLCASLVPHERRTSWAVRGVALGIGIVCIAALVTRLEPDLWARQGLAPGRLDFPITYWNGLGLLAGIGGLLGVYLTTSDREPWYVRVVSSALPPVAACTVYFTLSRGGISATVIGLTIYLVLGFSRATPGGLLALLPPTVVALSSAYDADLLVTPEFASPAGMAQGRDVAITLAAAVATGVILRALTLLLDRALEDVPGLGQVPGRMRAAAVALVAVLAVGGALATGAPGYAERQVDTFLNAPPVPGTADVRDRLLVVNNNGRGAHWDVALDSWRAEPFHGTGAGTYQNEWNQLRPNDWQVLDAHSLYLEVLAELGVVGFALLAAALLAMIAGLAWRLRGPDRPTIAVVLAAVAAWAVHAGVDWDWELAAVTIWVFGLAGIALARSSVAPARSRSMPRLLRLVTALGCLLLALSPLALWRSQVALTQAIRAFDAGDCPRALDRALDSLDAMRARAEPWELIAYCDVRLGQPELAVGAAEAAVRRDPDDWEYHYALALVRGAVGSDPRREAAEALRLNPRGALPLRAVRAFRTARPALWQERARALPLYKG